MLAANYDVIDVYPRRFWTDDVSVNFNCGHLVGHVLPVTCDLTTFRTAAHFDLFQTWLLRMMSTRKKKEKRRKKKKVRFNKV